MKYAKKNYLRRESRLEFALSFAKRVPLELWCQPKGYLAVQYQKPPMQIQSAMYMYVYTVFAIVVYPGSTYTLMYTWSTNWHNESLCFKMLLGKEHCHSCTKTTYQKTIELRWRVKQGGNKKNKKPSKVNPKAKRTQISTMSQHHSFDTFAQTIGPGFGLKIRLIQLKNHSVQHQPCQHKSTVVNWKPPRSTPTVPT